MKKLLFVLLLIFSITSISWFNKNICHAENLVLYNGEVHHLFTHCLIAHPDIAFDKNNFMRSHLNNDCITPNEFKNILNQLHKNNYVLVDINSIFETDHNENVVKKKLYLPKNKKPLVFSFDDVIYDSKKQGKGMVDKIIVDESGNLATITKQNNKEIISYDNEFITILESFTKKHPDFSFNGAKGTICLTGYDGILGYRTSERNKTNREDEIQKVKPVIQKLKQNGWNFACHSFGHYHMKKISEKKFEEELKLWNEQVTPLIGKTQVYVYPYGEWEVFDDGNLSKKHTLLKQNGFKLFCGVGMKPFFSYLPTSSNEKVLFMDRTCVDGYTLLNKQEYLQKYFDCKSVYDKHSRKN